MNNKLLVNIVSYLGMGAIGLLIGWLIFSSPSQGNATQQNINSEEVWTCSMHPSVRQPEPGDCPICGMDLIPAGEAGESNPLRLEMTAEAVRLAQVATQKVGDAATIAEQPQKELLLTGKVQMNEQQSRTQTAHIAGRIEQLFIHYKGEKINKGQPVARIYSPELLTAQKELLEAASLKDEMPALYEAAKAKLKRWKVEDELIEKVLKSGKPEAIVTVYADHAGVVMQKRVEQGDYVKQGQPLADLMDLNTVWVLFDVYEKDLKWVKEGQLIEFNLEAMPEKTFKSRISFIDPIIHPVTRVAKARVVVYNRNGDLKPDMFAKGILRSNKARSTAGESGITIPKSAVLWTGKRSVVYVKVPETEVPTYEYREVELGAELGDFYAIKDGLESGEEVVVQGTFQLDAAAQLNNKASMMNQQVAIRGQKRQLPNYKKQTPPEFQQQLSDILVEYIRLKDALVASDSKSALKAATQLQTSLEKTDMKLLDGEAHIYWMKRQKSINQHLEQLLDAKGLETQRKQFSSISELLTTVIKVFGISSGDYYLQHCPMAFDNSGANWISAQKNILNPYFGDEMLTCGVVKEQITISK